MIGAFSRFFDWNPPIDARCNFSRSSPTFRPTSPPLRIITLLLLAARANAGTVMLRCHRRAIFSTHHNITIHYYYIIIIIFNYCRRWCAPPSSSCCVTAYYIIKDFQIENSVVDCIYRSTVVVVVVVDVVVDNTRWNMKTASPSITSSTPFL